MTTRVGSKIVSLAMVATLGVMAACAPAPAKLLNPADKRALSIMVAPPVPCSDVMIDLVNTYAGCENYGGMLNGDKFTKYESPADDTALVTSVDVRCYDLLPGRISAYAVCAPTAAVLAKMSDPTIPQEEAAPSVATTQNTAGAGIASTSATATSNGFREATAVAGDISTQSSSTQNSDGTRSVSAGGLHATQNSDGSYSDVSFGN